ncbi:hypothetical protein KI387_007284, partial [Taxus chinensis]
ARIVLLKAQAPTVDCGEMGSLDTSPKSVLGDGGASKLDHRVKLVERSNNMERATNSLIVG